MNATFRFILERPGQEARYWRGLGEDGQRHAAALIVGKGFEGMREYWARTLAEEAAGSTLTEGPGVTRSVP